MINKSIEINKDLGDSPLIVLRKERMIYCFETIIQGEL